MLEAGAGESVGLALVTCGVARLDGVAFVYWVALEEEFKDALGGACERGGGGGEGSAALRTRQAF